MYPNIRVLLGIGCTLPVSFAEAEILLLSHVSETECLMSGCQDLQSCTYLMTLKFMLTKSVQSLLQSTRGGCSKGASFTSRFQVHGKGPRNYNVHRHCWEGVWGCGGSNLAQKLVSEIGKTTVNDIFTFVNKPLLTWIVASVMK